MIVKIRKNITGCVYFSLSLLFFCFWGVLPAQASGSYTWATISGGPSTGFCENLSASSTGQYVACANTSGDVFVSSDYGATWADQTTLGSNNWFAAGVSETGQYMAVGARGGFLYLSNNYGATWNQVSTLGSQLWYSAAVSSSGQYVAAVDFAGTVEISSDAGLSWSAKTLAGAANLTSVAMSKDGQYVYAADNGGSPGELFVSSDFGATWTPKGSNSHGFWESVSSAASGQYAVATDTYGEVYITSDYGATWAPQTVHAGGFFYNAIISSNGQYLMAPDVNNNGFLYESFDGGNTWASDTNLGLGSASGWWTITASYDFSRVVATDDNGVDYTGFNAALFVSPSSPGSSSPTLSTPQKLPGNPDTGYGAPNDRYPYLLAASVVCVGFGLVIFGKNGHLSTDEDIPNEWRLSSRKPPNVH